MVEVRVSAKGKELALLVQEKEFNQLGLDQDAAYEIVKARKGVWVLLEKEKERENPLDMKIFGLLKGKDLKDRVEGKFERFLGKEELPRFKEMLMEGSIVAFRLSPKYKRAVYKTREEIEKNVKLGKRGKEQGIPAKKESESASAKEKRPDKYSLETDGFLVFKNRENAKILSAKFRNEIEGGKIRGIKSFDGFFYVVESPLYQKYRERALAMIKAEKGIGHAKIAEKIGISRTLARIVCELLKDDGEIIEKRKDQFQAI